MPDVPPASAFRPPTTPTPQRRRRRKSKSNGTAVVVLSVVAGGATVAMVGSGTLLAVALFAALAWAPPPDGGPALVEVAQTPSGPATMPSRFGQPASMTSRSPAASLPVPASSLPTTAAPAPASRVAAAAPPAAALPPTAAPPAGTSGDPVDSLIADLLAERTAAPRTVALRAADTRAAVPSAAPAPRAAVASTQVPSRRSSGGDVDALLADLSSSAPTAGAPAAAAAAEPQDWYTAATAAVERMKPAGGDSWVDAAQTAVTSMSSQVSSIVTGTPVASQSTSLASTMASGTPSAQGTADAPPTRSASPAPRAAAPRPPAAQPAARVAAARPAPAPRQPAPTRSTASSLVNRGVGIVTGNAAPAPAPVRAAAVAPAPAPFLPPPAPIRPAAPVAPPAPDIDDWVDGGTEVDLLAEDDAPLALSSESREVADLFNAPGADEELSDQEALAEVDAITSMLVQIDLEGSNIAVQIDNESAGVAPGMIEVTPGWHTVTLENRGVVSTFRLEANADPDTWCFEGRGRSFKVIRCR